MLSSTNDKMAARLMLYMGWAVSAAIIEENGARRRADYEGRDEEGEAEDAEDGEAEGEGPRRKTARPWSSDERSGAVSAARRVSRAGPVFS
jgi:hypothetical protein